MKNYLKRNWGLMVVSLLVISLVLTNFNLVFSILGWDNFSPQLDLSLNFERTFFSTWRGYRGLGVASDSEVVDIFRIIPLALWSVVFPAALSQQFLYMAYLVVGAISSYFLTKKLVTSSELAVKRDAFYPEVIGIIGATSYLLSLHTLATFFVPVAMYPVRYAAFPLLILWFIKLLEEKKLRARQLLVFGLIVLFTTPSYLTATVFITLLMMLGALFIAYRDRNLKFGYLLVYFLALNAFWLLPFVNYAVHKSPLITKASTFIEVNQIQLNKPAEFFDWQRILTHSPTFYDTPVVDLATNKEHLLHPFFEETHDKVWTQLALFLPLALAVIALVLHLIRKQGRTKHLPWLAIVAVGSMFLLRKEYPPLGFVYDWLGSSIPFFKVIFRFGAEKFSVLLSLSLSLLAGLGSYYLLSLLPDRKKLSAVKRVLAVTLTGALVVLLVWPFSHFWRGQLFSSAVKVQIPTAYENVTAAINSKQSPGRVLHLPYDLDSYWKTYAWGYVGSAFLHNFLEPPLMDRTFEPAGIGNDLFFRQLTSYVNGAAQLSSNSLTDTATRFHQLLENTQTEFIIYDESVQKEAVAKGVGYFGTFPTGDTLALLNALLSQNLISLEQTEIIDLQKSAKAFSIDLDQTTSPTRRKLQLFKVNFTDGNKASYARTLTHNSGDFVNPFSESGSSLVFDEQGVSTYTDISDQNIEAAKIVTNQEVKSQHRVVQLFVRPEAEGLAVVIKNFPWPIVNDGQNGGKAVEVSFPLGELDRQLLAVKDLPGGSNGLANFTNDWHVLPFVREGQISPLRLAINDLVLPVPVLESEKLKFLAAVTLDETNQVELSLLAPTEVATIKPQLFQLTEDPNCFQDQRPGYDYQLVVDAKQTQIATVNGMTCGSTSVLGSTGADYFEASLNFSTAVENNKFDQTNYPGATSWQRSVEDWFLDQKPTSSVGLCLLQRGSDRCLNNHQLFQATSKSLVVAPAIQTDGLETRLLVTAVPQSTQQLELSLAPIQVRSFTNLSSEVVTLPVSRLELPPIINSSEGQLKLSFPYLLSSNSYYYNQHIDAFGLYTDLCQAGERSTSQSQSSQLFYSRNCPQGANLELSVANTPLLWTVDYNLFSGKHPQLFYQTGEIRQKQYLSRYQADFPDFGEFKSLQRAKPVFSRRGYQQLIEDKVNDAKYLRSFGIIDGFELAEPRQLARLEIQQTSENQGIFGLRDINVIPIPEAWVSLGIGENTLDREYAQAKVTQVKSILPSLWQVTVRAETSSRPVLLELNQAFDKQWQLYQASNPVSVLLGFGRKVPAKHLQVNGLTNGWQLSEQEFAGASEQTYYALYKPERLAILGWMVTLGALVTLPWSIKLFARFNKLKGQSRLGKVIRSLLKAAQLITSKFGSGN